MHDSLRLLHLLHLADSALPVGAAAHSFGMEMLVANGSLDVDNLPEFLRSCIEETCALDAWFVRAGHRCGVRGVTEREWALLNAELGAYRTARETRRAGLTMGRRLLLLLSNLTGMPVPLGESQYCIAFGYAAGVLGLHDVDAALAYAQQFVTGMLSCAQRLLPFGQQAAQALAWQLKPVIASAVDAGSLDAPPSCSTPMLDIGSMQHARMDVRLFIS
jgi:urease accessory protein